MIWMGSLPSPGTRIFAALRHPVRPVGEAVGLVARADDVARTHDGDVLAELLVRFGFAQRLQRTVEVLDVGTQGLLRFGHRILALVLRQRRVLVDARLAAVGIHRDGGDEEVVAHVALQHLGGIAHPERQAGGVVDADVPRAAFQRGEIAGVAVAVQLLDGCRPLRRRALATVEQGDLVPTLERVLDLERAGEAGAAEDQDIQRLGRLAHGLGFASGGGERRQRGRGGGQRAQLEQVTTGGHAVLPSGVRKPTR